MPRDKELKDAVHSRLRDAAHPKLLHDNIIRDAAGNTIGVACWHCHTPVAGYVDDAVVSQENLNGTIIQRIRQKFMSFNNQAKGKFLLDGGERYEPVLCKSCVEHVDIDVADKILARDVALYEKQESSNDFVRYILNRRVKGRQ